MNYNFTKLDFLHFYMVEGGTMRPYMLEKWHKIAKIHFHCKRANEIFEIFEIFEILAPPPFLP